MIELWHATHSTGSQKARLCLAEKQLAWTSHLVDLRRFEHLEPTFLRPRDALERARMREWTLYVAEEPTWAVKVPSFARPPRAG